MLDIEISCEFNTEMNIPESLGLGILSDVVHGVPGHRDSATHGAPYGHRACARLNTPERLRLGFPLIFAPAYQEAIHTEICIDSEIKEDWN